MAGRSGGSGVRLVEVETNLAGQRLDNFLVGQARGVPRSRLYRAIRKGELRVNGSRARPGHRLQAGDKVRIPPLVCKEGTEVSDRHDFSSFVIHEDDRLLIINKPSGWAVHGGSGIAYGVVEALRAARRDLRYLQLAHRLDRDTSGLLLLAKKRSSLCTLQDAMRERRLDKRYLALVAGNWPGRREQVSEPLVKQVLSSGERMVRVREDGLECLTRFRILKAFPDCTLVEARPVTGRTHQIRVHARHVGHPVIGDEKYGNRKTLDIAGAYGIKRLFLHALSVNIPDLGEVMAPLPDELESALSRLGWQLVT